MSRLRTLSIPFLQGQSDETDPNILPDGTFAEILNGRRLAQGSLRLRRGWRPLTMAPVGGGSALSAIDLYSYDRSLLAACTSANGVQLATYANAAPTAPWVLNTDGKLSPLTEVRAVGGVPDTGLTAVYAAAAITSDGVYGALLIQYSSSFSVVRVFNMSNDETLFYAQIAFNAHQKLVSLGTTFGLLEVTAGSLVLKSLNPAATTPSFSTVGTLVGGGGVTTFDAATARTTTPTKIHVATVETAVAKYYQFTLAGAAVGVAKTVKAATALNVAIDSNDVSVSVATQDSVSGDISLLTFSATSPFTTSGGPTTVAAAAFQNRFAVAYDGGLVFTAADLGSGLASLTSSTLIDSRTPAHGSATTATHKGGALAAGFVIKTNLAAAGLVFDSNAVFSDTGMPWAVLDFGTANENAGAATPPFAGAQAPTGDVLLLWPQTVRTNVVTVGARAAKLASTARRPGVHFGDAMYFVGGALVQWVGGYAESGMLGPVIDATISTGAGATIAAGTYTYQAVVTWLDEHGRKHFSEVSLPVSKTLGGAVASMTVTVYVPKTLRRSSNLITNPIVELYRTEAGPGELFYLAQTGVVSTTDDQTTLVDSTADSALISKPRIYTEGEEGSTSGVLEISPAEPSSFITAIRQRLLLGGGNQQYQFSQTVLPNEPVTFAEPGQVGPAALVYFDTIDGRITDVASQDDVAFVGSKTRLFVTGGPGPNLAGVGEFASPAELPADVGFFEPKSVIDTSEGLWFQGSAQYMYLAPRGSGAPVITQQVQAHLAGGVVGAGYDSSDDAVCWALGDATALVRLLAGKSWSSDGLPFTPRALIGHQGSLYAVASDGVVWQQQAAAYGDGSAGATAYALRVTTGPIQAFGLDGWGRLAGVSVLGTYEADAAILAEISYDEAISWTSLGTFSVTGLAAGTSFQRQFYPAAQRGGRFRVRLTMTPASTTTEGCRLTGLTLYLVSRSGPARLDSAKRK